MKRELICILCPKGCTLQAEILDQSVSVTGNACPRGVVYGKEEILSPKRTVTAVLAVSNRPDTAVSVKTEKPVPKEKVMELMQLLQKESLMAPLEMGQCILEDAFGTRVITTCRVL